MSPTEGHRLGPTRARDVIVVGVVAAVIGYVLTRFNYSSIPPLPRLAGLTAALIGVGLAVAGYGLRSRIRDRARPDASSDLRLGAGSGAGSGAVPRGSTRPPVPPLTAMRALQVAKASALAGAALAGLWLGFGLYVWPESGLVTAAARDTVTAVVGLACAWVLLAGALYLEWCCRAPDDGRPGSAGGR